MCLEAYVNLHQNHHTQQITIPSIVVRDSQYHFKEDEKLFLQVEPLNDLIIICRSNEKISLEVDEATHKVIIKKTP